MRESIVNSLTFAESSIAKFISEQPFIFLVIGIILLRSIIAQMIKSRLKKKYILPYENRDNVENGQFHLDYFKKLHSVNLFGVALILSLIFIYFVTKGEVISTVLAVAIWAMVITFQTFLVSFLMYFILMNKYKVWSNFDSWSSYSGWNPLDQTFLDRTLWENWWRRKRWESVFSF